MTCDFRKTIFKHGEGNGRDCPIEWETDFSKMEIQLRSEFISPALLIDCLRHIARADERFQIAGITDPIQISNRFNISLQIGGEMYFKLRVYQLKTGNEKLDRPEIELIPAG